MADLVDIVRHIKSKYLSSNMQCTGSQRSGRSTGGAREAKEEKSFFYEKIKFRHPHSSLISPSSLRYRVVDRQGCDAMLEDNPKAGWRTLAALSFAAALDAADFAILPGRRCAFR